MIFGSIYAPTNEAAEEVREAFWRDVLDTLEVLKVTSRDVLIIAGDTNCETGRSEVGQTTEVQRELPIGPWGCGDLSDNSLKLLEICGLQRWFVAESFVNRPPRQKWSFRGNFPCGLGVRRQREYDHFLCSRTLRKRVMDVRNIRGTLLCSDHCLRTMEVRLGGKEFHPGAKPLKVGALLRGSEVIANVNRALEAKMDVLSDEHGHVPADLDVNEIWTKFKIIAHEEAKAAMKPAKPSYLGISKGTLTLIEERAVLWKLASASTPSVRQVRELWRLKAKIQKSVRWDKTRWLDEKAREVQTAVGTGQMRMVHKVIRQISGKVEGGAANLQTVDLERWRTHFINLLGTATQEVPPELKEKRTWKLIEEMLAEKSKFAPKWDVDASAPTLEEFRRVVMAQPNEKGLSRDQIPIELFKHSERACVLMWKLTVKVWDRMASSSPGEEIDMPADWVNAVLVCLFKGKGSRDDPAMYRGISLISVAERLMASIVLKRVERPVDEWMRQNQNGFRPLKSCRDSVFRLWRELEKAKEMKVPTIYTFVDFSKAFDSLVWARMWEIIEFSGCPTALLAVIRCLHEHATISIRLNSAGDLAAEFKQKKGIRQGSGLSPCLFVLVLDFVFRVYEIACAEVLGLDRTKAWNAYADDVADRVQATESESAAELEVRAGAVLQQLEGAAAAVGLLVNVPKTEVMGCGVMRPESNAKQAWRERATLTFHGPGRVGRRESVSMGGWITCAKWSRQLGIETSVDADAETLKHAHGRPVAVMLLDPIRDNMHEAARVQDADKEDGSLVAVRGPTRAKRAAASQASSHAAMMSAKSGAERVFVFAEMGSGNVRMVDGTQLTVKRLGFSQCMNGAKFGFVDCPNCHVTMLSDKSLANHLADKTGQDSACVPFEDAVVAKTLQQLTERRANRLQEFKKRGLLEGEGEERVTVMTCTGGPCKPCDSFVYLGTRVATDARAMGEIKRRIQRAWVTMGELDSVWISRQIGWRLKGSLFTALVLSTMLYNAEVWPIRADELRMLEGTYFRMVRSIVARATRAKLQRARLQARLGSKASREEKSAELDELTVPQLTALCGRYGLDRNGAKADMVSRLCIAMCKDGPVTAAKLASEDAREAKRVELCGLKVPALKGLCDEHKLSKAGVKADLVSRLCDALAPVAIAKRTGEAPRTGKAARETKLAELRALKVPELKQLCDQHDVRKTGKKEELVARLCDALSNAEQPAEKTNFSKAEVLKMLDLPEMHSLLRQKRLRWVGHALRRKDGDLSKDTVKQELARKSSTWTACVLSDMEALNIGGVVALEREANNRESFRKLTSAYTQK